MKPAKDEPYTDEGYGSRHAQRHCRPPGPWGHHDRREPYRERDVVCPLGPLIGPWLRSRLGKTLVLENLGGEVRAPNDDNGAQQEVQPASYESERQANQRQHEDRERHVG